MNCLRCEVIRAKLLAGFMWAIGKNSDEIAKALTEVFGAQYFVDKGEVWRSNAPRNIKIGGAKL